jgi:chemotaxis signal transduction protein
MHRDLSSYLTVVFSYGKAYVDMNWIKVIHECNNVKYLPRLKKYIDGISVFDDKILPLINLDGSGNDSLKTLVIRHNSRLFMLSVLSVSSISQFAVDSYEYDQFPFILNSDNRKIVDINAISRYLN